MDTIFSALNLGITPTEAQRRLDFSKREVSTAGLMLLAALAASLALIEPPSHMAEVTPNDDEDLQNPTRAIHVFSDGNLHISLVGSGELTIPVTAGQVLPYRVKRVFEDSTATVVALW